MNDLNYKTEDFQFFARVSALIVDKAEQKVLLFNVEGREFYMLPGGKIKQLEESKDAIKREIKEEIGWDDLEYNFLGISEEFVEAKGTKNHQISLLYKAVYKDVIKETEFNGLDGTWSNFKWVDIKDIENYKIYPKNVKTILNNLNDKYHIVENLITKN